MRKVIVATCCVLSTVGSVRAQAPDTDDRQAVMAVVKQLFDGMQARDTASIRKLFHPSAQLFSSSVRDGKPAINVIPVETFLAAVGRPGPELND